MATHTFAAVTGERKGLLLWLKKGEERVEAKERRRQNPVFYRSVPTEKIISHPQYGAGEPQEQTGEPVVCDPCQKLQGDSDTHQERQCPA